MKLLLILLVTMNTAFAGVTHIKKGEAAPSDGYFITYEQEKKFRQINEENEQNKKVIITLKDLQVTQDRQIAILQDRLVIQQEHNAFLSSRIDSSRSDGFWNKTFHFVAGAALMGTATYLASKNR
jgi:hypothetical protein